MKSFILKHRWKIFFWLFFLSIVLFFAPRQSDYYLDSDIKNFKSRYLVPTLFWTGIIVCVLLIIFLIIKNKSFKQPILAFLYGIAIISFFLFIFQDLFLAMALFINRQADKGSLQKVYVVNYLTGTEPSKESFLLYDIAAKQITTENKLTHNVFHIGIKQNDTIALNFDKGLFGIAFQQKPFGDK